MDVNGYRNVLVTKHLRQRALALQTELDLRTAGRLDLWRGRLKQKLHQSELIPALQAAHTWPERRALASEARDVGTLWAMAQAVNAHWPALGTWLRNHSRLS